MNYIIVEMKVRDYSATFKGLLIMRTINIIWNITRHEVLTSVGISFCCTPRKQESSR